MSYSILDTNSKYARDIGFDLGHSNSSSQAALFNGLAQGFKTFTGDQSMARDMQISYIVDELDDTAKKFIQDLAATVEVSNG